MPLLCRSCQPKYPSSSCPSLATFRGVLDFFIVFLWRLEKFIFLWWRKGQTSVVIPVTRWLKLCLPVCSAHYWWKVKLMESISSKLHPLESGNGKTSYYIMYIHQHKCIPGPVRNCQSVRKKEHGNREDAIITDQCEMIQSEVCGVINPVLNHCPSNRAARKLAGAFTLDKSLVSGWQRPRRLCIRWHVEWRG